MPINHNVKQTELCIWANDARFLPAVYSKSAFFSFHQAYSCGRQRWMMSSGWGLCSKSDTAGFIIPNVVLSLPLLQLSAVSPRSSSAWIPGLRGFLVAALQTVWMIGRSVTVSVGVKWSLSPYASLVMSWQPVFQVMTTKTHLQNRLGADRKQIKGLTDSEHPCSGLAINKSCGGNC